MSDTSKTANKQHFNILPHPATSNNPADLLPGGGASLAGNPAVLAHHARGPHVPNQELLNKLEAPASREELRKRAEELNKK